MPTIKQRKAFDKIVENRGNVSKSMREVGYDLDTAKNPKNLTESKGFKELCDEYGLTDDFLIKSLIEDIRKKPQNRKPELELGFKIKGKLEDKNQLQVNVGVKTIIINKSNGYSDNQPLT